MPRRGSSKPPAEPVVKPYGCDCPPMNPGAAMLIDGGATVTGCRRGEVPGLKWDKVDWKNKQIYIDCNLLYRKELGIYEDTPKTKGSVRYIRLPDQTMDLLAEYHRWYKEEKFRWGD